MKIIGLLENTTVSKEYESKHGLSLYIETSGHKILFDTGSDDKFIRNAEKLGVNLSQVDICILSHGHVDHGGGLRAFLEVNNKAKVYIQKTAFEDYRIRLLGFVNANVGIDKSLKDHPQVVVVKGNKVIDGEIQLLSEIEGKALMPEGNRQLYRKKDGKYELDQFAHEQSLIITTPKHKVLVEACAHGGIINILEQAEEKIGGSFDYVIGGFHLIKPMMGMRKHPELVTKIGEVLKTRNSHYYTCHCTGTEAFEELKTMIGDQLKKFQTGTILEL